MANAKKRSKQSPKSKTQASNSTSASAASNGSHRKEMESMASKKHSKDIEQHMDRSSAIRNDPETADMGFDDNTLASMRKFLDENNATCMYLKCLSFFFPSGDSRIDVDEDMGEDIGPLRPGTLRPIDDAFETGKYEGERVDIKDIYDKSDQDKEEMDEEIDSDDDVGSDDEYHGFHQEDSDDVPEDMPGNEQAEEKHQQNGRLKPKEEHTKKSGKKRNTNEITDELAALEAEDEAQFVQMSKSSHVDREKGQEVKQQTEFFERLLETRILSQKLMKSANRLPRGDAYQGIVKQDESLKKSFSSCISLLKNVLSNCVDLQIQTLPDDKRVKANCASKGYNWSSLPDELLPPKKRQREEESTDDEHRWNQEEMWSSLTDLYEISSNPMREVIDQQYERVNHSKGRNKAMKALYQPISKQVDEILSDRERLNRRAHPKAISGSILGEKHIDYKEEELDKEVYDDSEFYQALLKEFLNSKTSEESAAAQSSVSGNLLHSNQKNQKKQVDRRASKGRKLRFAPQPKLVNFMAPEPHPAYDEYSGGTTTTRTGGMINLDNLVKSVFRATA